MPAKRQHSLNRKVSTPTKSRKRKFHNSPQLSSPNNITPDMGVRRQSYHCRNLRSSEPLTKKRKINEETALDKDYPHSRNGVLSYKDTGNKISTRRSLTQPVAVRLAATNPSSGVGSANLLTQKSQTTNTVKNTRSTIDTKSRGRPRKYFSTDSKIYDRELTETRRRERLRTAQSKSVPKTRCKHFSYSRENVQNSKHSNKDSLMTDVNSSGSRSKGQARKSLNFEGGSDHCSLRKDTAIRRVRGSSLRHGSRGENETIPASHTNTEASTQLNMRGIMNVKKTDRQYKRMSAKEGNRQTRSMICPSAELCRYSDSPESDHNYCVSKMPLRSSSGKTDRKTDGRKNEASLQFHQQGQSAEDKQEVVVNIPTPSKPQKSERGSLAVLKDGRASNSIKAQVRETTDDGNSFINKQKVRTEDGECAILPSEALRDGTVGTPESKVGKCTDSQISGHTLAESEFASVNDGWSGLCNTGTRSRRCNHKLSSQVKIAQPDVSCCLGISGEQIDTCKDQRIDADESSRNENKQLFAVLVTDNITEQSAEFCQISGKQTPKTSDMNYPASVQNKTPRITRSVTKSCHSPIHSNGLESQKRKRRECQSSGKTPDKFSTQETTDKSRKQLLETCEVKKCPQSRSSDEADRTCVSWLSTDTKAATQTERYKEVSHQTTSTHIRSFSRGTKATIQTEGDTEISHHTTSTHISSLSTGAKATIQTEGDTEILHHTTSTHISSLRTSTKAATHTEGDTEVSHHTTSTHMSSLSTSTKAATQTEGDGETLKYVKSDGKERVTASSTVEENLAISGNSIQSVKMISDTDVVPGPSEYKTETTTSASSNVASNEVLNGTSHISDILSQKDSYNTIPEAKLNLKHEEIKSKTSTNATKTGVRITIPVETGASRENNLEKESDTCSPNVEVKTDLCLAGHRSKLSRHDTDDRHKIVTIRQVSGYPLTPSGETTDGTQTELINPPGSLKALSKEISFTHQINVANRQTDTCTRKASFKTNGAGKKSSTASSDSQSGDLSKDDHSYLASSEQDLKTDTLTDDLSSGTSTLPTCKSAVKSPTLQNGHETASGTETLLRPHVCSAETSASGKVTLSRPNIRCAKATVSGIETLSRQNIRSEQATASSIETLTRPNVRSADTTGCGEDTLSTSNGRSDEENASGTEMLSRPNVHRDKITASAKETSSRPNVYSVENTASEKHTLSRPKDNSGMATANNKQGGDRAPFINNRSSDQESTREILTPKRSSRLKGKTLIATPKRYDDFYIPHRRSKSSPKTKDVECAQPVPGDSSSPVAKTNSSALTQCDIQSPPNQNVNGPVSVLENKLCQVPDKALPPTDLTQSNNSESITASEDVSEKTATKHDGIDNELKSQSNNLSRSRQLVVERNLDVAPDKRHTQHLSCDLSRISVDTEAPSSVNQRNLLPKVTVKKRDKLKLQKVNRKGATRSRGASTWTDTAVMKARDKAKSPQSCEPKIERTVDRAVAVSSDGGTTNTAEPVTREQTHTSTKSTPLKLRFHRTSQGLAIVSSFLANAETNGRGVSPRTSVTGEEFSSKHKSKTGRLKKGKKSSKVVSKPTLNTEDLMANEALAECAFTLWKSEKEWEIQQIHPQKSLSEMESVQRANWVMLAKDERKGYFVRALAALTDENKHSPERFITKLPLALTNDQPEAKEDFGNTTNTEMEITDRKLQAFRQMLVAKQHNLLRQYFSYIQRMLSKEKYAKFVTSIKTTLRSQRAKKPVTISEHQGDLEQEYRDVMFREVLRIRNTLKETQVVERVQAEAAVRRQFKEYVMQIIAGHEAVFDPCVRCPKLRQTLVDLQDLERKAKVSVRGDVRRSESFMSLLQDIECTGDNWQQSSRQVEMPEAVDSCRLLESYSDEILSSLPQLDENNSFAERLLLDHAENELLPLTPSFLEECLQPDTLVASQEERPPTREQKSALRPTLLEEAFIAVESMTNSVPCCELHSPSCVLSTLLVLEKFSDVYPQSCTSNS